MNKKNHDEAVEALKEICKDLGCTKQSVRICDEAPQTCTIIRNLMEYIRTHKTDSQLLLESQQKMKSVKSGKEV